MRKPFAALAGIFAALSAVSADAATFRLERDTRGTPELRLTGSIEAGDACTLAAALRDNRLRRVVINSEGGALLEGIAIGQVIRAAAVETLVPADGEATSAAALAFLGGSPRRSYGPVKLHQPYIPWPAPTEEDRNDLALGHAEMRFWLQETGAGRFANQVFATPPSRMISVPREIIDSPNVAIRNSVALAEMAGNCHLYVAWTSAP